MALQTTITALVKRLATNITIFYMVCATSYASDYVDDDIENDGILKATLSQYTKNVLTHTLLHELGHAIIREFSLPVLGNEENIADSFANVYITQHLRDDAVSMITHRAQSWLIEDSETQQAQYDYKGEHDLDIRRAYSAMCLLYGADPAAWADDVRWVNFSQSDLDSCSDSAPQQIDSWNRELNIIKTKSGIKSQSVSVSYGKSLYRDAVIESSVLAQVADIAKIFDWPKVMKIRFDHCDEGAYWNRVNRTITLCDDYVVRFIKQEKKLVAKD